MLTVSDVVVTDDLKIAKIYLSFLENKKPVEDVLVILKQKHNTIRHYLGSKLTMKYTPELRFFHDDTLNHVERIENLINKTKKND